MNIQSLNKCKWKHPSTTLAYHLPECDTGHRENPLNSDSSLTLRVLENKTTMTKQSLNKYKHPITTLTPITHPKHKQPNYTPSATTDRTPNPLTTGLGTDPGC